MISTSNALFFPRCGAHQRDLRIQTSASRGVPSKERAACSSLLHAQKRVPAAGPELPRGSPCAARSGAWEQRMRGGPSARRSPRRKTRCMPTAIRSTSFSVRRLFRTAFARAAAAQQDCTRTAHVAWHKADSQTRLAPRAARLPPSADKPAAHNAFAPHGPTTLRTRAPRPTAARRAAPPTPATLTLCRQLSAARARRGGGAGAHPVGRAQGGGAAAA